MKKFTEYRPSKEDVIRNNIKEVIDGAPDNIRHIVINYDLPTSYIRVANIDHDTLAVKRFVHSMYEDNSSMVVNLPDEELAYLFEDGSARSGRGATVIVIPSRGYCEMGDTTLGILEYTREKLFAK